MTVEEVTPEYYQEVIRSPYFVFGSAAFNRLNEKKTDKVVYLLFKDEKYRAGVIGGVTGGVFSSPFSAPFGGFSSPASDIRFIYIERSVDALEQWSRQNGVRQIRLTLPPSLYNQFLVSRMTNTLFRKGFGVGKIELNHYFDTSKFNSGYLTGIWHNARKNFKAASGHNLKFQQCTTLEGRQVCYDVIRQNREKRGFPLRMSWEDVNNTTAIVPSDFFVVQNKEDVHIGAAIVFRVAEGIVQVIYWGDIPDYADLKTMNFLSYKVFEFYQREGLRFVDIGPSTENSIPNYGLCDFKESIGCDVTPKFSFTKDLQ